MPFTASHAVVALPFARTPIPAGAVAVGAMAPDLPLFFRWGPDYATTHGLPGVLWATIPIALLLYAIWRLALRPAASALLPAPLGARLPAAWDRPSLRPPAPAALLLVLLGVALGVATHVLWDGFTHPGRFGSEWLPLLAQPWGPLDGTSWLQHASSLLGLAGLAAWAALALRRAPVAPRDDAPALRIVRAAAWTAAAFALVGFSAAALLTRGLPTDYRTLADTAFSAGTRAGAAILVIALVAAIAVRLLRRG